MASLSNTTIPIVTISIEELEQIAKFHEKNYSFEKNGISASVYLGILNNQSTKFKRKWKNKGGGILELGGIFHISRIIQIIINYSFCIR